MDTDQSAQEAEPAPGYELPTGDVFIVCGCGNPYMILSANGLVVCPRCHHRMSNVQVTVTPQAD